MHVKKEKRQGLTTSLTEFLRLPFLSKNKNLSIGEFRLIGHVNPNQIQDVLLECFGFRVFIAPRILRPPIETMSIDN